MCGRRCDRVDQHDVTMLRSPESGPNHRQHHGRAVTDVSGPSSLDSGRDAEVIVAASGATRVRGADYVYWTVGYAVWLHRLLSVPCQPPLP